MLCASTYGRGNHSAWSRKTLPSGGSTAYPTFKRGRTEPDSSRAPEGMVASPHLSTVLVSTSTVESMTPTRARKTDSGNVWLPGGLSQMMRRIGVLLMNITVRRFRAVVERTELPRVCVPCSMDECYCRIMARFSRLAQLSSQRRSPRNAKLTA